MAGQPVAPRMNLKIFQEVSAGSLARVGGRISIAAGTLATTDGGSLRVLGGAEVLPPSIVDGTFVEVVGTRAGSSELQVLGVVPLPGKEVDTELWDEAVKLMHLPQLRDLFQPRAAEVEV